ncbi:MAG: tandem-95 repeat protein [Anaerolineae bacterium]|nr:tandem-95 repeat protein [Anaerolineae bacterium]
MRRILCVAFIVVLVSVEFLSLLPAAGLGPERPADGRDGATYVAESPNPAQAVSKAIAETGVGDEDLSLAVTAPVVPAGHVELGADVWTVQAGSIPAQQLSGPASCRDIRAADPTAEDGEYTIYPQGKVFAVYCHDMAGTPSEYLSLVNTGETSNFAQYTAGGSSPGTNVRTTYDRVRIDPYTLLVDIGDQTFAHSMGSLTHGTIVVTSMPYGVAADCLDWGSDDGVANIDLRGTPFAVSEPFLLGGYEAAGQAVFNASSQVVDLVGGGYCGWIQPDPYLSAPYNDQGGFQLDLKYIGVIYVDAGASGAHDGSSWTDAYANLQDALAVAVAGSEIWVAQGIYTPLHCPVTRLVPEPGGYWYLTDPALPAGLAEIRLQAVFRNDDPWGRALQFGPGETFQLWSVPGVIAPPDLPVVVDQEPSGTVAHGANFGYDLIIDLSALPAGETALAFRPVNGTSGTMPPAWAPVVSVSFSCPADLRSATFGLKNGVALYGGFAGVETSREQRDWQRYPTTLSGDIGAAVDSGDNSYHVLTSSGADATAILDGFTVTGGNADGEINQGGGMLNDAGSPTIRNVVFKGNGAQRGGGMASSGGSPTLEHVTFSDNWADMGAGMANYGGSATLRWVTFENNVAGSGGGMANYESSSTLINVTFSGNSSEGGGGMDNRYSGVTLVNVVFSGNRALFGGSGGGMQNNYSNLTLVNVTLSGNQATDDAGGMANYGGSAALTNCILWGNTSSADYSEISNWDTTTTIRHSLVHGSGGSGDGWDVSLGDDGGGNLDEDPLFVDPPASLRLQSASPAVDAGDNAALPADTADLDGDGDTAEPIPFDRAGQKRLFDATVDMGAYEYRENRPPVAVDDVAVTDEDLAVVIAALDNDDDPDGDGLIVYSVGQPEHGRAERVQDDTRIRYTPFLNFDGSDSFDYVVYDGYDGFAEATVTVVITPSDDLPLAVDDVVTTPEDEPVIIDVLANDSDPEGDSFALVTVGAPAHGTASLVGTTIRYTPALNFNGSDRFFYTLSGSGGSSVATVWVTVTPVNDLPTDIVLSNDQIAENMAPGELVGSLSAVDPDGEDSHSFGLVENPDQAFRLEVISLETAIVLDYEARAAYGLRISADDGSGRVFARELIIYVLDTNDAPTGIRLSQDSVPENAPLGTVVATLSALDPDSGDTGHTFELVAGSGDDDNRFFDVHSGHILVTQLDIDYEARTRHSIRMRVDDGHGGTYEQAFSIAVVDDPTDPALVPLGLCMAGAYPLNLIDTEHARIVIHHATLDEVTSIGCVVQGQIDVTVRGKANLNLAFAGRVNDKNQLLSDSIGGFELTVAGLTLKVAQAEIGYYLERPLLRLLQSGLYVPAEWGGLGTALNSPAIVDGSGIRLGTVEIPLPEINTKAGFSLNLRGELIPVVGGYEIKATGELTIPNIGKKKAPGSEGQECTLLASVTFYVGEEGPGMRIATHEPLQPAAVQAVRLSEITVGLSCSVGIPIDGTGFALTAVKGTVNLRPNEEYVQIEVTIATMKELGGSPLLSIEGGTRVTINPSFQLDLWGSLKVLVFTMANASATITTHSFSARLEITTFIFQATVSINAWTSQGRFHFTGSGSIRVGVDKCAWVDGPCIIGYPSCRWCRKWFIYYPCGCTWKCAVYLCLPPFSFWLPRVGCDFGEFTGGAYGFKGYAEYGGVDYGFYIDHTGKLRFGNVTRYVLVTSSQVQDYRHLARIAQLSGVSALALPGGESFILSGDDQVIIRAPIGASAPLASSGPPGLVASATTTETYNIQNPDVSFVVTADGPLAVTLIAPNGDEITPLNYSVQPTYTVAYQQVATYTQGISTTVDGSPPDDQGARLRFVSASPHPSMALVDVALDGVVLFAGVGLTDTAQADYVALTPGLHSIGVTGLSALSLSAVTGTDYTVVTLGATTPTALLLSDDNRMPAEMEQARVRFVNGGAANVDLFIGGIKAAADVPYLGVSAYRDIPAGEHLVAIQDPETGVDLSPAQTVTFEAGKVYTFISADLDEGLAWLQTLDEAYVPLYHTEYSVDQAEAGEWQVKLDGDLDQVAYAVTVLGPANPPVLREPTVDASTLDQTEVSWQLISDHKPTTMTLYITPGPITKTLTVTDTGGAPVETVVPSFEGMAIDQVTISADAQLAGETITRTLDLSTLNTGDYFLWIRAEDGVSPPVSGYLALPGSGGIDVEVAKGGYDALTQLAHAALIHVESPFPSTWTADIRTSANPAQTELYVEWDALDQPDVDMYVLHVGASPISATRVISAGGAIVQLDETGQAVGDPVGFTTVSNIEPGQWYTLSVEAQDRDTGRAVRSQEIVVSVGAGDFSLSAPALIDHVGPGDTLSFPLSLVISETLYYPEVSLAMDLAGAPYGLSAQFAGQPEGIVTLSAEQDTIDVEIAVPPSAPDGTYTLSFTGYNGALERTVQVSLRVGATAVTLLSFTGQSEGGYVILNWETAAELDSEGFHLWRSDLAPGPYTRLTSSLIPAQGSADSGASYQYIDKGAVKGSTAYYKLEEVDSSGVSTFYGPVAVWLEPSWLIYMPVILRNSQESLTTLEQKP